MINEQRAIFQKSLITDHRSRINKDDSVYHEDTKTRRSLVNADNLRSSPSVASVTGVYPVRAGMAKNRRGFTLIEIMFAIAILGVGLIMVAATFPIAIKWTTQDAQKTIGQTIAQSAVAYLANKYGPSTTFAPPATTAWNQITSGTTLSTYSLNGTVPYSYTVGQVSASDNPYALYSWTAVIRLDPISFANPSGVPTWDVYIFVFNKGDISTYGSSSATPVLNIQPPSTSTVGNGNIPIGTIGLDIASGQVVRIILDPVTGKYSANGMTNPQIANDLIIYAPPAAGQTVSPTVYVYATTLKF